MRITFSQSAMASANLLTSEWAAALQTTSCQMVKSWPLCTFGNCLKCCNVCASYKEMWALTSLISPVSIENGIVTTQRNHKCVELNGLQKPLLLLWYISCHHNICQKICSPLETYHLRGLRLELKTKNLGVIYVCLRTKEDNNYLVLWRPQQQFAHPSLQL